MSWEWGIAIISVVILVIDRLPELMEMITGSIMGIIIVVLSVVVIQQLFAFLV